MASDQYGPVPYQISLLFAIRELNVASLSDNKHRLAIALREALESDNAWSASTLASRSAAPFDCEGTGPGVTIGGSFYPFLALDAGFLPNRPVHRRNNEQS